MATIIDALIVTLGLDVSNIIKSAAQAQAALAATAGTANATSSAMQAQAAAAASALATTAAAIGAAAKTATTAQTTAQTAVTHVAQTSAAAQVAAQNNIVVLINNTATKAHQAANSMNASGKLAAEFFGRIKNAALEVTAVFLGGKSLGGFVAHSVSSLAALGRAANITRVDVAKLAGVGNAVEKFGGNAEAATQSFVALADGMQAAISSGDASKVGGWQAIGVQLGDTSDVIFDKLAKYAETHSTTETRFVARNAGIDNDLVTLAMQGQRQSRKEIEEGALRSGVTKEMVANMTELQKSWAEFSQTALGVGRTILNLFAPAMIVALKVMKASVEWVRQAVHEYPQFTRAVVALVAALTLLKTVMAALTIMRLFTGGAGALGGMASALSGFASSLGLFSSALTSLLLPLAGLAAWWEALHIRGASGAEELAFEKKTSEQQAADNPDQVVPSVSKPDPAREFWQRNAPAFLGGNARGGKNMADPAQLLAYFKSQGWTEDQAAGIIANFKGESNLDAGAVGDRGASAGLGQWRGPRRQAFKAMFGHDVQNGSVMEQAQFAQWELTHTEKAAGDALRATTNKADAARAVSRRFERPGQTEADKTMNAERRAQFAMDPALLRARPPVPPARVAQNDNSSETHIGTITIHTQATDAKGIARSIDPAIRNRSAMVAQANSGLS